MRALRLFGLPLLALAGCFTATTTLEPNGAGTIELEYIPGAHATIESETARFTSPHVKVEELAPRQVGAFLRARFDDVTQLPTAEGFNVLTVRRDRKHNQERLRVLIRNPTPKEITETSRPGPQIILNLPGRVLGANRDAQVGGSRVSWNIPIREYARRPAVLLSVRYVVPPAA